MSSGIPESAWAEFFAECEEILQRVSTALPSLETSDKIDNDLIDSLYRDIHTLKGSAQLFGFKNIGIIAHAVEASLEPIRTHKIKVKIGFVDIIFKCLDLIDQIIKNPDKDLKNDPALKDEMMSLLPRLIALATKNFNADFEPQRNTSGINEKNDSIKKEKTAATPKVSAKVETPKIEAIAPKPASPKKETQPDTPQAPIATPSPVATSEEKTLPKKEQKMEITKSTSQQENNPTDAGGESSTIRVQVAVLDKLMNLVGEMVLVRNQVLQTFQSTEDFALANVTQRLDVVTSELQEQVMKTRMQTIGSIVTKFQRVVRDLGRDLNKQLDLVIRGADTELDKSLLEAIKDPLTHLVRNACDHGIELPSDRKKNGKPELGTIVIKAFHEGGQVVIEIIDDGRGLNPEKLIAKAIEKKILTPERAKTLTEKEAFNLIFAPGFSTAESVSSVSGRGVGMDVVKTNIEKVGGMVELQSTINKGTSVRLKIPLTLAIVPAMIVSTNNEQFAIPQVKLQELVRVDRSESTQPVEFLQGKPVYRLRGQLLPLVSLKQILGHSDNFDQADQEIFNIVVLSNEGLPFGLIVDQIQDTADIVVKPLPNFFKKLKIYSGATIMGDGSVALILDMQALAERSEIRKSNSSDNLIGAGAVAQRGLSNETQEFLFFTLHHPGRFCMPLVLVQRLEEFPKSAIEVSGQDRVIRYRNSLLPLIDLSDYLGPNQKDDKSDFVSIVVVSKRRRQFGIVVKKIADVLTIDCEIESSLKEKNGIMGTIIVPPTSVATVVDVFEIIEDIIGETSEKIEEKKDKNKLKGKVLFAEDTIFFMKQVKKLLEESGLEVDHALDGEIAFKKLLDSKPGDYSLILSDIEMPNKNGFEFAEAVRANPIHKNIPMIALTTRFKESDVAKGKAVGFTKYLEKLKSEQLLEALRETLGGSK